MSGPQEFKLGLALLHELNKILNRSVENKRFVVERVDIRDSMVPENKPIHEFF